MEHWNLSLRVLLFVFVVLLIPIFIGVILPIFKPTIKRKSYIYLYSLSAGFILVLGIMGLIALPLHHMAEYFGEEAHYSKLAVGGISSAVALGGILIGVGGSLLTRHLIIKHTGGVGDDKHKHNHDNHIFNISEVSGVKAKATMIVLLSLHKVSGGLTLGILIMHMGEVGIWQLTAIIAFILHMIPVITVIYYRQIEMGINRWKAMLTTIGIQFLLIPGMFIGAYAGEALQDIHWLIPLMLTITGTILVFTAIVEVIPEFIDNKITNANWHATLFSFISGFSIAIIILLFHTH